MGAVVTKEDRVEGGSSPLDFTKKSVKPEDTQVAKNSESKLKEDVDKKVSAELSEDADSNEESEDKLENYDPKTAGPIFPDGSINWDCPCLGGAAYGPCGTEFRDAFSCFHFRYWVFVFKNYLMKIIFLIITTYFILLGFNSKEDPKGSECFPQFREMHTCFSKYPDLYKPPKEDDDDDDELEEDREDEIQFDEDELKVINEEAQEKNDTKKPEEKIKSDKDSEPLSKKSASDQKKSVKKEETNEKVIVTGQPAMMWSVVLVKYSWQE